MYKRVLSHQARKVTGGCCGFVVSVEEKDELTAESLETIYKNRNEQISQFTEENRKANDNSFQLGLQDTLKAKEKKRLTNKQ